MELKGCGPGLGRNHIQWFLKQKPGSMYQEVSIQRDPGTGPQDRSTDKKAAHEGWEWKVQRGTWSNFLNHWGVNAGAAYSPSATLAMGDEGAVRGTKPSQALCQPGLFWGEASNRNSNGNKLKFKKRNLLVHIAERGKSSFMCRELISGGFKWCHCFPSGVCSALPPSLG